MVDKCKYKNYILKGLTPFKTDYTLIVHELGNCNLHIVL